jgi:hypothetical protein
MIRGASYGKCAGVQTLAIWARLIFVAYEPSGIGILTSVTETNSIQFVLFCKQNRTQWVLFVDHTLDPISETRQTQEYQLAGPGTGVACIVPACDASRA